MSLLRNILFISSFLFLNITLAGEWKPRAREHFENYKIETDDFNMSYRGFTNTFNYWFEEKEKYSLGIALSPILGKLSAGDTLSENTLGAKASMQIAGLEFKYFPLTSLQLLYIRTGLFHHTLKGDKDEISGIGSLLTIGYEIPYKMVNFALEVGCRKIMFEDDIDASATTIALGVHFYRM